MKGSAWLGAVSLPLYYLAWQKGPGALLQDPELRALIVVTDKAMRENQEQVTKLAGRELGRAWAEDVDTQLITNFDNFATSLGGATTEITPKYALAAMGFLQGNSTARIPMDGDVFGVLHPYQGYELQSALSLPGTSNVPLDLQSKLISRMFVASLFGARLFISGLITVSSDAAKGAIYHRQAIVKVEQLGMRIEEERDATLRATEYVLCGDWGHGEYKDTWGVEMFFYAQTPSGTTI